MSLFFFFFYVFFFFNDTATTEIYTLSLHDALPISRLEQRALASGRMYRPFTVDVNQAGTVANITVPIEGKGSDAGSNASLALLRNGIVPETVGALPGTEAGVTGFTAQWKDSKDDVKGSLPPVVA